MRKAKVKDPINIEAVERCLRARAAMDSFKRWVTKRFPVGSKVKFGHPSPNVEDEFVGIVSETQFDAPCLPLGGLIVEVDDSTYAALPKYSRCGPPGKNLINVSWPQLRDTP